MLLSHRKTYGFATFGNHTTPLKKSFKELQSVALMEANHFETHFYFIKRYFKLWKRYISLVKNEKKVNVMKLDEWYENVKQEATKKSFFLEFEYCKTIEENKDLKAIIIKLSSRIVELEKAKTNCICSKITSF